MGKIHSVIDARLAAFIASRRVFFVATAPLAADGHVNVSPKGIDGTSCLVDEHTFAYLDITASGAETIAHLRQNGRITIMFCAFEGPPNILRLHGTGRVITIHDDEFPEWASRFDAVAGAKAVIVVDVERISDSCGYGVPLMTRRRAGSVAAHMARKGLKGPADYRRAKNRRSLDGLPAFDHDD